MIKLNIYQQRSTEKVEYIVYETEEQWIKYSKKLKLNLSEMNVAQKGDYVLSDNGYYVPLIRRHQRTRNNVTRVQMIFPLYIYNNFVNKLTNQFSTKYFIWKPNHGSDVTTLKGNYKTVNMEMILKLMDNGYSYARAYKTVFAFKYDKAWKQRRNMHKDMYKYLNTKGFINLLIKNDKMKGLNMAQVKAFKNDDYIVWLKAKADNMEEDSKVRTLAMQEIIRLMADAHEPIPVTEELKSKIDKEMEDLMERSKAIKKVDKL